METVPQHSRFRHLAFWLIVYCSSICGTQERLCHAFPVARLRAVRPIVETQKSKKTWSVARDSTTLVYGDQVRAGPQGTAQIVFNDATYVVLRPQTQIQIVERKSPAQPLVLRLLGALGEVLIRARGTVEVRTAAGIAAVRGTTYSVRLDSENQTTLTVSEGRVVFYNPQGSVEVGANEQSTARVGSAPTPPVRVDASGLLSWAGDVGGLPLPFELPATGGDTALNGAKAQLQSGDALGAQASFRALLTAPSAGVTRLDEARAGLALALLSNGQRTEARQTVAQATTPLATGVRALFLLEDGDALGARQLLQPLSLAPDAPFQLISLLSLAQIQNGDLAGASQSARRAVQLNPQSAGAFATLALAQFFGGGNDKEARRNARRAVALDPFSPLSLLSLGRVEAARGNLDEARQALEQAAALAPELPGAQRDLGALEATLDRLPRAERAYRATLVNKPDDARALAGLGTVLLRRGARAEAKTTLDRAVELAPNDSFVRAQRAAFLVENGDLAAAAREGDLLLARQNVPNTTDTATRTLVAGDDPTLGALFIRLSEAALFQQKLNDALRYARAAVRVLPDSSPAQYQLGRVFLEQGRTTQAQNRFQLATVLDPNAPRPRYALGYTQELIAQGGDLTRPLGQIQAAREGAPNVALSLQNQATPGAFERLQAAIQDPTAVRAASRSFGDWQLDGNLGSDSSETGDISYAKESADRRGLTAFGLHRDTTAGARVGAESDQSRVAITLGQKSKNSPSALFAFASFERINSLVDGDFDQPPSTFTTQRRRPLVILGANLADGQGNRTRFLLQFDHNFNDSLFTNGTLNGDYGSIHAEVRHDRKLSGKWNLSTGVSAGQRRYDVAVFSDFGTPNQPLQFFTNSNVVAHNNVAYARVAVEPSPQLKLEAELKVRDFSNHVLTGFLSEPPNPFLPPSSRESSQSDSGLLPTFVATYRSGRATLLRFRARRELGAIEDFELLSPTDLFSFESSNDIPTLDIGAGTNGRGTSYELELSHTFANASFLRLGLFRAGQRTSYQPDTTEFFDHSRVQGLRVGYEGIVNRQLSFFSSASWNGSRALTRDDNTGGFYAPSTISGLPDYSAEVGLQQLSDDGVFVQPSLGYLGPRYRARYNGADARQRLGGLSIFNLRVGKRFGLRRSFYIEVSDLFNRSYTLAGGGYQRLQPGRQLRVGATLRF